jgi:hypothetical protein
MKTSIKKELLENIENMGSYFTVVEFLLKNKFLQKEIDSDKGQKFVKLLMKFKEEISDDIHEMYKEVENSK